MGETRGKLPSQISLRPGSWLPRWALVESRLEPHSLWTRLHALLDTARSKDVGGRKKGRWGECCMAEAKRWVLEDGVGKMGSRKDGQQGRQAWRDMGLER